MIDVCLERRFATPLTTKFVLAVSQGALSCYRPHSLIWRGSLLANDGRRMFCHFQAPDAESARTALQQAGADTRIFWLATIHDAPAMSRQRPRRKRDATATCDIAPCDTPPLPANVLVANVLVERTFDEPVVLARIQAREDDEAACLQHHRVRFVRTFFARNRRRMICLYQAPDAESVRLAQRQAGIPFERVWAFHAVLPDDHANIHAAS
ncbi:DUF4242 domain-containing protein [Halomonas sp. TRM85114]|uniref:nickel-binding protein n=1 Tax=Halomonas jincaotanensis TaxID=2810616 RepID=UPI001BD40872|nr:nickel-binding protein [Halomonas jincaotanensis]MBS9402288.1 DUF4242 domain-containing protein [Halomonas jincaotanensis]